MGVAHEDPIFAKVRPKMIIFRGFSKNFSELLHWLPIKVINISIESLNIFHWKPAKENQSGCGLGAKFGSS